MKIGGKKPEVGTENYVKKAGDKDQARKPDAGAKVQQGDNVEISEKAKELGAAKRMLDAVPEVRGEMVVRLKTDISRGQYDVDAAKVAEKMIERAIRNSLYGAGKK